MTDLAESPIVIFDGDCGFCKRCVLWLQVRTGSRVEYKPYQDLDDPRVEAADCAEAVHLIDRDGVVSRGAEAVVRAYAHAPGRSWLRSIVHLPGFAALTEPVYRRVAKHRIALSRCIKVLSGPDPEPSSWLFARRAFLMLLGLALFVAFVSLWSQVDGLFGRRGLMPIETHTDWSQRSWSNVAETPTLLWLSPHLETVKAFAVAGMVAAGFLILGLWPRLMIGIGFLSYVSLVNVGSEFFDWPWDRLLCEVTFLAWFVAPRGRSPRWREAPSTVGLWLLRLLLIRVLLISGLFKLLGTDHAWQTFSAFEYQLWSQPLPTWPGYFLYWNGSNLLAEAAAISVVTIEIAAALLLLGPRRLRGAAVLSILVLQLALAISGNHAFLPLLVVALALFGIDDQALRAFLPRRIGLRLPRVETGTLLAPGGLFRVSAFVLLVSVAGLLTLEQVRGRELTQGPVARALDIAQRVHLVHSHVLHASIRERRPELVLEGSYDGKRWRELDFRFKPGEPDNPRRRGRLLPWIGLHAPRLDFQMHRAAFAAEGDAALDEPWMLNLVAGILGGAPSIYKLLDDPRFERRPPVMLRVKLYRYRFIRPFNRRYAFWRRQLRTTVVPPIRLEAGEVVRAW